MSRFVLVATTILIAALAATTGNAAPPLDLPKKPQLVAHKHRPDELLVRFKANIDSAKADREARTLGGIAVKKFAKLPGFKATSLERWRRVTLPRGANLKQAMERFNGSPDVEYVEPNYLLSMNAVPNDPDFPDQWSLRNTGQEQGVPGADIDAVPAWDLETGDNTVVIAVIDSGIALTHPDIAPNLWVNVDEIPGNGVDDDNNGYVDDVNGYDFTDRDGAPNDAHGHGTHVAGIAAAVGNNGRGIAGVAWNARVMVLKFIDADGLGDTEGAIDAIMYAINNGAKILNNSYGNYTYSQALYDAVSAANDAGALYVASAGNDDSDNDITPHYPSGFDLPNIVSVAATTRIDAKANFSNYGRASVDIGAPGDFIYSLDLGSQYSYRDGTSMAAPHVAGAAALLLSRFPSLNAVGLKALLLDRSEQIPSMFYVTSSAGRLNARLGLECNAGELILGVRAPADDFAVLEGEPTTVQTQVSACGEAEPGYQLVAEFSNGDGHLQLFDDGQHGDGASADGIFGNYWLPQTVGAVSTTITATHASLPQLNKTLNGNVRQRVRYQHVGVPYAWIDATSGTQHSLGDDGSVTIPMGFNFDFYGVTKDTVTINSNGLLTFGSALPAATNTHLPDPTVPNNLIAPFWDDLSMEFAGYAFSLLEGSAPNRRLTVAWQGVHLSFALARTTFEVTLYEGSNDIVFNYQDVQFEDAAQHDFGARAIVGVEDQDGLDATVYSAYQRLIKDSTARRFYVVPSEPRLTYRVTVNTGPIRSRGGELVMSVVDGDGVNSNYFSILRFSTDGDVIVNPTLIGDASGSFIPGPAHIGDASFSNEISQPTVFGDQISFLMHVSRNGTFQPFPDGYAFYLLDSNGAPYPTTDPLGTDSLFAIEVDRAQPYPQVFQSAFASAAVETVGAPTAVPGGPYTGTVNVTVNFNGSASSDPEGQALNYLWDFGDGSQGIGATPSHTYAARGIFTATLIVDDGALFSAPATTTVAVGTAQPPIADAGPDQSVPKLTQSRSTAPAPATPTERSSAMHGGRPQVQALL